jgi:uncharacterized protein (TIGR02246 family)
MRRFKLLALVAAAALVGVLRPLPAAEPTDRAAAEAAIRAAAQRYTEALKSGDAKALAELWAEGGEFVDEFGNATPAKDVVAQEATLRAASAGDAKPGDAPSGDGGRTIKVVDNHIRFIAPDAAIEDGKVEVTMPGSVAPLEGRFTAVWVLQDDQWRLTSLREVRLAAPREGDLTGLDWMVGKWSGKVGPTTFEIIAHWNEKHTYLLRDLTVTHDGKVVLSGQQRIGIDPIDGLVKSWMHDADGGHGEGVWTRHGDTWIVRATGVSPDGKQTTGTNLYKLDGKNRFTWKSTGATSNGEHVPDFSIVLERVEPADK